MGWAEIVTLHERLGDPGTEPQPPSPPGAVAIQDPAHLPHEGGEDRLLSSAFVTRKDVEVTQVIQFDPVHVVAFDDLLDDPQHPRADLGEAVVQAPGMLAQPELGVLRHEGAH